jgi:hypothetical protein
MPPWCTVPSALGGAGKVARVLGTARWSLAALYTLLGVGWVVMGAIGSMNWVLVGIGIVWMFGGACWALGQLRRRRQRSAASQL